MTATSRHMRNGIAVAGLHPEFAALVTPWLSSLEAIGMHAILIVQARRDPAAQAALWAQGRTTPGKVVTNAPPGHSFHEYGLAIDFLDIAGGTVKDEYDEADWKATDYSLLQSSATVLGMSWGGAWRTQDLPHLEWHPTYGPRDAQMLIPFCHPPGYLPTDFFASAGRIA